MGRYSHRSARVFVLARYGLATAGQLFYCVSVYGFYVALAERHNQLNSIHAGCNGQGKKARNE